MNHVSLRILQCGVYVCERSLYIINNISFGATARDIHLLWRKATRTACLRGALAGTIHSNHTARRLCLETAWKSRARFVVAYIWINRNVYGLVYNRVMNGHGRTAKLFLYSLPTGVSTHK